jgi:hypothetical protein
MSAFRSAAAFDLPPVLALRQSDVFDQVFAQQKAKIERQAENPDAPFPVLTRVKWNPARFALDTPHNKMLAAKRGEVTLLIGRGDRIVHVTWDDGQSYNMSIADLVVDEPTYSHAGFEGCEVGDRVLYTVKTGTSERYFHGRITRFPTPPTASVKWEGTDLTLVPMGALGHLDGAFVSYESIVLLANLKKVT